MSSTVSVPSTSALVPVSQGTQDYAAACKVAESFRKSGYWTDVKDFSKAVVKIMIGQSLGIDPLSAMSNIVMVQGKPSMSANLMARLLKASGKYRYTLDTHAPEECTITLYEKVETGPSSWEWFKHAPFTRKRDEYKHLFKNPTWNQYPRDMLYARTISSMIRTLCPEVLGGSVYLPDELPGTEGNMDPETFMPRVNDIRIPGGEEDNTIEAVLEPCDDFDDGVKKAAKMGDLLAKEMVELKLGRDWLTRVVNKQLKSWDSLSSRDEKVVEEALKVHREIHDPGNPKCCPL